MQGYILLWVQGQGKEGQDQHFTNAKPDILKVCYEKTVR